MPDKYSNLPRGKSLPPGGEVDSFDPTPSAAGSVPASSMGGFVRGSGTAKGLPADVDEHDATDNATARRDMPQPPFSAGGAAREHRPADVDKGYNVRP